MHWEFVLPWLYVLTLGQRNEQRLKQFVLAIQYRIALGVVLSLICFLKVKSLFSRFNHQWPFDVMATPHQREHLTGLLISKLDLTGCQWWSFLGRPFSLVNSSHFSCYANNFRILNRASIRQVLHLVSRWPRVLEEILLLCAVATIGRTIDIVFFCALSKLDATPILALWRSSMTRLWPVN